MQGILALWEVNYCIVFCTGLGCNAAVCGPCDGTLDVEDVHWPWQLCHPLPHCPWRPPRYRSPCHCLPLPLYCRWWGLRPWGLDPGYSIVKSYWSLCLKSWQLDGKRIIRRESNQQLVKVHQSFSDKIIIEWEQPIGFISSLLLLLTKAPKQ